MALSYEEWPHDVHGENTQAHSSNHCYSFAVDPPFHPVLKRRSNE
jgi:hypothetical protein